MLAHFAFPQRHGKDRQSNSLLLTWTWRLSNVWFWLGGQQLASNCRMNWLDGEWQICQSVPPHPIITNNNNSLAIASRWRGEGAMAAMIKAAQLMRGNEWAGGQDGRGRRQQQRRMSDGRPWGFGWWAGHSRGGGIRLLGIATLGWLAQSVEGPLGGGHKSKWRLPSPLSLANSRQPFPRERRVPASRQSADWAG